LVIQEGCQKGIHPSNAGHPLSQSIADIIIQEKKTQKTQKHKKIVLSAFLRIPENFVQRPNRIPGWTFKKQHDH